MEDQDEHFDALLELYRGRGIPDNDAIELANLEVLEAQGKHLLLPGLALRLEELQTRYGTLVSEGGDGADEPLIVREKA